MSVALKNKLADNEVDLINEYYDRRKPLEWQELLAYKFINNVKHWITYGGNPHGGFVYFYKVQKMDGINGIWRGICKFQYMNG